MFEGSRIQFPRHAPDPLRSLARRFGIAVGIIVVIAVLTWLGRGGYSDPDGSPVSMLDAFYYATVTATTTGDGDIAPVGGAERAVTAFVVTPLRILFLIVLVDKDGATSHLAESLDGLLDEDARERLVEAAGRPGVGAAASKVIEDVWAGVAAKISQIS